MRTWESRKFLTFFLLMILSPLFPQIKIMAQAWPEKEDSLVSASSPVIPTIDFSVMALSEQWKKLLFYNRSWSLQQLSLVDDPSFFAAPNGKHNPEAELRAVYEMFTQGSSEQRQEALCQFPARRLWLEKMFNRPFVDPQPENTSDVCRRLRVFQSSVRANKVSLIFSSYFPGNPGSLFGHTLLKFARVDEQGKNTNELLDFGLNHAAFPTTYNPLLYAPMGLSGFFPGYISFMPYYVKVQEYNNLESRDLWEYELNLTPEEIKLALLSVFELSTRRIDYYYFDDNCSLLMLALIDVARPSLKLVEKFNSWVIPGDTVRVVFNQPNLVSQVRFRASNVRRYLHLEQRLTHAERIAFDSFVDDLKGSKLDVSRVEMLPPAQRMSVIDTLLEYMDAVEQIVAAKESEKWKNERSDLLAARATLRIASQPIIPSQPVLDAPHLAYPPTRVSMGAVTSFSANRSAKHGLLFGWRPALHTLDNPVAGMGADLGIAFLDFEYLIHDKGVVLREFTPLGIETIPVDRPHLSSRSWGFSLGYRQRCFAGCAQTTINTELGRAWKLMSESGRFAIRGGLRVGDDAAAMFMLEPGIIALVNLPFEGDKRWVTRASLSVMYSQMYMPMWMKEFQSTYVFRPFSPLEINLSLAVKNEERNVSARASWYF